MFIRSWSDLPPYGIKPLTVEACGLSYRLLCDVTESDKRILERSFDAQLVLTEPWNQGAIGSIMLAPEMLVPLGVFAFLESGCTEVWRNEQHLMGLEPGDDPREVEQAIAMTMRRYAYDGTAGSRNIHQITGRVV